MGLDLLWEITLGSWVTAALILLARLLFGRWLTARGKYLLWLPLLLRLLLPFMPPSPTSVLNVLPESVSGEAYLTEIAVPDPAEEAEEPGQTPVIAGSVGGGGLRPLLLRIWLTGAAAVLLFQFLLYRIGAKAMDRLPLCTDPETRSVLLRLRQLTGIDGSLRMAWGSAGMLGGLLRPTLVLPVERRKEAAAPIMLHELMHQKSRHLWLGLLLRLLSAAYWFNPIVWLCLPLVRQDCEELCDQMVLDTGLIAPREYSSILFSEGQMNGLLSPLPRTNFGGRRGSLRRRIGRIVRSREGRGGRILPALLVLCILLFGATAPLGAAAAEERSPIPPGYESMDAYLNALQPGLGRFGATFRELTAEGYLKEEEGEWLSRTELCSAFTLRRELYADLLFRPFPLLRRRERAGAVHDCDPSYGRGGAAGVGPHVFRPVRPDPGGLGRPGGGVCRRLPHRLSRGCGDPSGKRSLPPGGGGGRAAGLDGGAEGIPAAAVPGACRRPGLQRIRPSLGPGRDGAVPVRDTADGIEGR